MPHVIQKPWGHETILETNPDYTVKQIFVKAGHRLSEQFHNEKVETMLLVSGTGYLQIGDETVPMYKLWPYYIPPKTIHRLVADAYDDCLIVEISSSELDDVVRTQDDYQRE